MTMARNMEIENILLLGTWRGSVHVWITLWLFNIAMGNGPFIDGLPIENGGSFHGYVK
jgi:hypothetical protein